MSDAATSPHTCSCSVPDKRMRRYSIAAADFLEFGASALPSTVQSRCAASWDGEAAIVDEVVSLEAAFCLAAAAARDAGVSELRMHQRVREVFEKGAACPYEATGT